MQWRKSSVSSAVDDEACVEVAPLTFQEAADLLMRVTMGRLAH